MLCVSGQRSEVCPRVPLISSFHLIIHAIFLSIFRLRSLHVLRSPRNGGGQLRNEGIVGDSGIGLQACREHRKGLRCIETATGS